MKTTLKYTTAAAVLFGFGYFGYQSTASAQAQAPLAPDTIPAPTTWVPFDASIRQTDASGKVTPVGRFYRASDGSTRDDYALPGKPIAIINIRNIPKSTYWVMQSSGKWFSYKMKLPAGGYKPRMQPTSMVGLETSTEKVEGFDVWRDNSPDRGVPVRFTAPQLNWFALRYEVNGGKKEYYDVRVREQPRELFFPPPDAQVVDTGQWGGIVNKPDEIGFVPPALPH
jgi:hypothetical protein